MGKFNSLRFIFEDEFRQKWEDGREEGREAGRQERDLEVAMKLLRMNLAPSIVAEGTGLPLERVQSLAMSL